MPKIPRKWYSLIGKKGGKVKGDKKRRGDKDYYIRLARLSAEKRKSAKYTPDNE